MKTRNPFVLSGVLVLFVLYSSVAAAADKGTPFQASAIVSVLDGNIVAGEKIFDVPSKRIALIEQVSISTFGFAPPGQKIIAGIDTDLGNTSFTHEIALLSEALSNAEYFAFQLVRIYADEDTSIEVRFNRRPTAGSYDLRFVISGLLFKKKK